MTNKNIKTIFTIDFLYYSIIPLLILYILINPPLDPDMFWHLKAGETMFETKEILLKDVFSHTKLNQPWVNAFWLSDLFLYWLYKAGGFPFLITTLGLIGIAIFYPIFIRTKGNYFVKSLIILLAALCVSPQWTARPQIFSFLLFAFLNFWLDEWMNNKKKVIFFIPFLFIVWANIHGGFIWGILLLFAAIASKFIEIFTKSIESRHQKIREFLIILFCSITSSLVILINPNGIKIWKLPFNQLNISLPIIEEWHSPDFHQLINQPFLWMVLIFIFFLGIKPRKLTYFVVIKLIGFLYLAFLSQRNIPIAILTMTPLLMEIISDMPFLNKQTTSTTSSSLSENKKTKKIKLLFEIFNLGIISITLGLVAFRVNLQTSSEQIKSRYPVKAVSWLKSNSPDGNILNSYNSGGFLIWSLPRYPVFIDGRADLYGEEFINDWWSIVEGRENAISLLNKYDVNIVLLEPDWPINDILIRSGWILKYLDENSMILMEN